MSDNASSALASEWIRSRLSALYDPGGVDVFDRTFSPACEVRANHVVQPLHALREELAGRSVATTSIAWDADVDVVSGNEHRPEEPAIVVGAFVVTRTLAFRIRAGPAQRWTRVHFSARIEQDLVSAQDDGDRRRITSFYYTSVDRTPPIHFTVPCGSQEKVDGQ